MKILVTYASAGAGHRRAAEALYDLLKERAVGSQVELVDALKRSSAFYRYIYQRGYSLLVNRMIWLWGLLFWMTSQRWAERFFSFLNGLANRFLGRGFDLYLSEIKPDIIVSTHFFPSEAVSRLKTKGFISARLITVVTDLAVHPFWVYPATDTYVVASSFAAGQLSARGISSERVKELGIPVDKRFLLSEDRQRIARDLGISGDAFTVLVVTGSFGIGPIEEIVSCLRGEAQLLVVCAANERLRRRLAERACPGVKVFGYVGNINEMMSVSDLIITKPGGLTVAEILIKGVAPVFISPIPGQETANAEVLSRLGIGETALSPDELKKIVLEYKANPSRMQELKEKMRSISRPQASASICDLILG